MNATECLALGNTYELVFCNKCGRILSLTGETQREQHPWSIRHDGLVTSKKEAREKFERYLAATKKECLKRIDEENDYETKRIS
jgi:UV DNA damage repair endonuclease